MTTFDSLLGHVRDAATDMFGDDTDEVLEMAGGFLGSGSGGRSGSGGEADGGDGFDWGEALTSFLGDSRGDGSRGDGGGEADDGWGFLGRVVERLAGGGSDDDVAGRLLQRAGDLLPDEVRGMAGDLLGPEAASWAGRLVDPTSTDVPDGWQHFAGAARGLGLGLGDGDGAGGPGWSPSRAFDLAAPLAEGIRPFLGAAGVDPDLLRLTDLAGRGGPVAPGRPDGDLRSRDDSHDDGVDGNGHSDDGRFDPVGHDDHNDSPDDGPAPVDYDELVTSGTSAPGYEAPGAGPDPTPDDPTFPSDPDPAPPMDDFRSSIDEADQVEESMDDVFEGP